MPDDDCVAFLQWALPPLGKRWSGYRKVRRQVCRRARRRAAALGLDGLGDYRAYLECHADEWPVLDGLTHITISRFYRDRGVFDRLLDTVLPDLATSGALRVWSAGCASGEEAYTLSIAWEVELAHRFPGVRLGILATDVEPPMLACAERACYSAGSLRELPARWRHEAFDDALCVQPRFRRPVSFQQHDLRDDPPDGPFDLVLCRHLAFTYFDETGQRQVLRRLAEVVVPGGGLLLGTHEHLPAAQSWFVPWPGAEKGTFRRTSAAAA